MAAPAPAAVAFDCVASKGEFALLRLHAAAPNQATTEAGEGPGSAAPPTAVTVTSGPCAAYAPAVLAKGLCRVHTGGPRAPSPVLALSCHQRRGAGLRWAHALTPTAPCHALHAAVSVRTLRAWRCEGRCKWLMPAVESYPVAAAARSLALPPSAPQRRAHKTQSAKRTWRGCARVCVCGWTVCCTRPFACSHLMGRALTLASCTTA